MTTDSHDAVNYHKMEFEEQSRREVAHESDATRMMTNRKSQSGEKKQTSARDTREAKPRIGAKEVCNACLERETVTRSQPATGERGQCMSQPRGEQKNADETDVKDKEKQPGSESKNP